MFLPTTKAELKTLGWTSLDVILVSGDTYIDSPLIGVAVIGKVLLRAGFKVGVIAQPDTNSPADITRLGEPSLFWGVSGGSVDSMVANYTATQKKRRNDDYTPGGANTRRPDRATIIYSNLIRQYFKNTVPIVLGGIEASLRRIAHYDFWSNKVRRSILFDAKADYLTYGMGEQTILDIANHLKEKLDPKELRGICYRTSSFPESKKIHQLPSFEEARDSHSQFTEMFQEFYRNQDAFHAKTLVQQTGQQYLVQTPPQFPMTTAQLDDFYEIEYEYEVHPYYRKQGPVRALDTIRFSVATHRGCYGECNFCAITVHQGRTVQSRSIGSIKAEVERFARHPKFKGNVTLGGSPTGNMYGFECDKKLQKGCCTNRRCLYPEACNRLQPTHKPLLDLLQQLTQMQIVKRVFVTSGIRYDLILEDAKNGKRFLEKVIQNHLSGQMKIAPEHTEEEILALMGKPGKESLESFTKLFEQLRNKLHIKRYLTYYLIAAHPGSQLKHMQKLKRFVSDKLRLTPEQVQIYTPTPSTFSSLMYYTQKNPFTGQKLFVEKNIGQKYKQKSVIVPNTHQENKSQKASLVHSNPKSRTTMRKKNKS